MKKIIVTNLLVFIGVVAFAQTEPINPEYIGTDSITSSSNNSDLKLVGRGTGLVNIEGAYTLPGVDGTSGYLISTNGAGVWGYTDPASITPSGAALTKNDDTNVTLTLGGTPTTALLQATSLTLGWTGNLSVARGGSGAGTFTDGGILYGNGTSAFSVTAAPAGADEFLVSTGAGTWGLESATSARTSLGLGTMATETATNYVPFTGAAQAVNLNTQDLSAGIVSFTTGTFTSTDSAGTITLRNDDANNFPGLGAKIGQIQFQSDENGVYGNYGRILVEVDVASDSDYPGRMLFQTTPDGSSTPQTRLTINNQGAATFSGSLSAGATTTTTMRNSSNAGTGDDISYYDSDGDLIRSTIEISSIVDASGGAQYEIATFSDANTLNGQGLSYQLIGGNLDVIYPPTSDGSDNRSVQLGSGGSTDPSRGAYITLQGNEFGTGPGTMELQSGTSGSIAIVGNNTTKSVQIVNSNLELSNSNAVPSASIAESVIMYSQDVAASAELKVRDEAGNITVLSPHNFTGIPEGRSEPMAWSFYSEKDGKYVNVDMLKLARLLEELTGEKLIFTGDVDDKPNPENK